MEQLNSQISNGVSTNVKRGPRVYISRTFLKVFIWWAKKTGPFLRVYNFATVGARNACDVKI